MQDKSTENSVHMQKKIPFVYPSMKQDRLRGGLVDRWELAIREGCSYIEIPANFIRSPGEYKATHLNIGEFLDRKAIATLYRRDTPVPTGLQYIFHTDPSFAKDSSHPAPPLKWHDRLWVAQFNEMLIEIAQYLGHPPSKIEIHPGGRENTFRDIALAMASIQETFFRAFGTLPDIILENRRDSIMSQGPEMAEFWHTFVNLYPDMAGSSGVVFDASALWTVSKMEGIDYLASIAAIPKESVKGLHIHCKHQAAAFSNDLPWKEVFAWINGFDHSFFLNPEVHQREDLVATMRFCRENLG
jgi:hypothetical protein